MTAVGAGAAQQQPSRRDPIFHGLSASACFSRRGRRRRGKPDTYRNQSLALTISALSPQADGSSLCSQIRQGWLLRTVKAFAGKRDENGGYLR
jgi:hypothetical protein